MSAAPTAASTRCDSRAALAATVLLFTIVAVAVPQGVRGAAAADSAAAARAAWGRAEAAFSAGDLARARHEIDRAAVAWPLQPAYIWGRVVMARALHDTTALLRALDAYAALGLGRDLSDTAFAPYRALPAFAALRARLDSNRKPVVRSTRVGTLPDSTFWPEGMDADPRTGRLFVASVRWRTIAEVLPDGQTRELWPRGREDLGAVLGVRVDTARNVVWVTTSGIPQMADFRAGDSAIAALLEVRPDDGAIIGRWNLAPVPGGHVLGDLAVGPRGDVYFTDSNQPVLYRLHGATRTLRSYTHPLFRSLQGIAPRPEGRIVYVADYSHGLLRVDVETGKVTRLDDAPRSTSLGCDGLAWDRGAIIAVQNGVSPPRIVRFSLDRSGTRITAVTVLDRNVVAAPEPTIGAVLRGAFIYVANSQWDEHDDAGRLLPGARLTRPALLSVPLHR